MRRAVCPGSYDPPTNGHLDIIERASGVFDEVVVAVMINNNKRGMFSVDERMELLRASVEHLPNVKVDSWHGLLVQYCQKHDIKVIVKGLRAVSDFDYELQMAQMNNELSGVETLFMPTKAGNSFLSSSLVKEVATHGGSVAHLLPDVVDKALSRRIAESR